MSELKKGIGGVQYEDLLQGTGEVVTQGSYVEIQYILRLNRGETIQEGVSQSFRLGERSVIPGLEYGVEGMRVGGKRRLRVGPHLAYGKKGVSGLVPPRAVLEFEVTLLSVTRPRNH